MSEFKPTFIYIKQHSKTGLLYFGKTFQDPEKYKGSGEYWKAHCKIHGKEINTLWYQLYLDKESIQEDAVRFSIQNKIVESEEWANLVIENGINSGRGKWTEEQKEAARGKPKSDEWKALMSEKYSGENNPMFRKSHTEETRAKMSKSHTGKRKTEEQKLKMSGEGNPFFGRTHSEESKNLNREAHFGKVSSKETRSKISNSLKGRVHSDETKAKQSEAHKSYPLLTCPHCGYSHKTPGIMGRYHLDRCKQNPDRIAAVSNIK